MKYEDFYVQRSERNARLVSRWRIAALLGFTALIVSMAGLGFTQRDVRAVRHQAVRACDAGWETCRAATGFPVREGDGTCTWRHRDATYADLEFGKLDAAGKWHACPWTDEPTEEAADDESSCGLAWSVCLREATK